MLIEEVIRSCAVGPVAEAAVTSLGGMFAAEVRRAASAKGMSLADFTVSSVGRFARNGREQEMRAVALAMSGSQAPVLAAVERILVLELGTTPAAMRGIG